MRAMVPYAAVVHLSIHYILQLPFADNLHPGSSPKHRRRGLTECLSRAHGNTG